MPDHRRLPDAERFGDLLHFSCPYIVDVDQDQPGIHNRNALPWSRLFLIHPDMPAGNHAVTDVASGQRHRLTPGSVLLMPSGMLLGFDFAPGLRMVACHFRLEWAPGCDVFAELHRCVSLPGNSTSIRDAAACLNGTGYSAIVRLRAVLLSLASQAITLDLDEVKRRFAAQGRFAPVLQRMANHVRPDLPIRALAKQLGMGREHFTREFRRHFAIPPKEHHHRLLMQRACALLLAGNRVKDVAETLGFTSEFYFSRFFKQHTGIPPRDFRAAPFAS